MYMRLKEGKRKVLTLSYDDGPIQEPRFIEVLDRYGLKCTVNLNAGVFIPGNEKFFYERMTLEEAKKLYIGSEHEVAGHTLMHTSLDKLNSDEVVNEVIEDRKILEREFQRPIKGMAYPFGSYNDDVIDVLKKCGICYARTAESSENFDFPKNWLAFHPTCRHKNPRLMEFAERFVNEQCRRESDNWMFRVMGHSFEFAHNNNWEIIEEFAKYVGGREDIWYATNIEIYDYVKAYENLQTRVDKKIIHNPSAIDVWVCIDGQTYVVKGGETLYV